MRLAVLVAILLAVLAPARTVSSAATGSRATLARLMPADRTNPPDSAEELLRRYAAGERGFTGADLRGADLRGADLTGAYLRSAKFRGADLRGAYLTGANLTGADLHGADLCGAYLRSVSLIGATVGNAKLSDANLSGVNLRGADLGGAYLGGANLTGADLRRAHLSGAYLSGANLRNAALSGANLLGTNLIDANFSGADLRGANLTGADLRGANLCGAYLIDANFSGVELGSTLLLDVDLSPLADADPPVAHHDQSPINFRSIIKSLRSPKLKSFLQRTGMPDVFVEYDVSCAESLDGSIIRKMLQSTFISYGHPDEPFARKLYEALHRNGVTTFFFPEHAVPGDKLHRTMRKGVNEHDRVILVCSKASLDRNGVANEIEETLAREARDGGAAYLIPIRLDGYVFSGWNPPNPDTAQPVRDRVVADFEGADTDQAKFDAGILRLIAALKK